MSHAPLCLSPEMLATVEKTLQRCAERSPWKILAASLEPTHLHLQIEYTHLQIENTVKWITQEMTIERHDLRRGDGARPYSFLR